MIKYVNGRDVFCNNSTKMRSYPGAVTDNFIDYLQPNVCQMPNLVIVYTGRNDFQNNINTIQKLRKVISTIRQYGTGDYIEIALFSIVYRSSHNFKNNIIESNRKLKPSCKSKSMIFINNNNIDNTCLNRSKLHLSSKFYLTYKRKR